MTLLKAEHGWVIIEDYYATNASGYAFKKWAFSTLQEAIQWLSDNVEEYYETKNSGGMATSK